MEQKTTLSQSIEAAEQKNQCDFSILTKICNSIICIDAYSVEEFSRIFKERCSLHILANRSFTQKTIR